MLTLIAATAISTASPFVADFEEVDANHRSPAWEGWQFTISNRSEEAQDFRMCPSNVERIALDPARTTKTAFALALGGNDWKFDCVETTLEAGENVRLKAFTRPYGLAGSGRTLVLRTDDGELIPIES